MTTIKEHRRLWMLIKKIKVFCDVSAKEIAPFLIDLKRKLDSDLKIIETALTAQAEKKTSHA